MMILLAAACSGGEDDATSSPTAAASAGTSTPLASPTSASTAGASPTVTATPTAGATASATATATATSPAAPTSTPSPGAELVPTVTFVVDSIVDAVDANPGDGACDDGGGNCTLRAAIMEANAVAGVAAITLPSGTYTIAIGRPADVSELHPGEDAAVTGDLDIADDLIIEGAGSDTTIVDGGALDRVFHVLVGSTVEISGLTVRNGDPAVYGLRNAAKSGAAASRMAVR